MYCKRDHEPSQTDCHELVETMAVILNDIEAEGKQMFHKSLNTWKTKAKKI